MAWMVMVMSKVMELTISINFNHNSFISDSSVQRDRQPTCLSIPTVLDLLSIFFKLPCQIHSYFLATQVLLHINSITITIFRVKMYHATHQHSSPSCAYSNIFVLSSIHTNSTNNLPSLSSLVCCFQSHQSPVHLNNQIGVQ